MRQWCGVGNVRQPWDETRDPREQSVGTESKTGCVWRPVQAAGRGHGTPRQGRNSESCSEPGRSTIRVLSEEDRGLPVTGSLRGGGGRLELWDKGKLAVWACRWRWRALSWADSDPPRRPARSGPCPPWLDPLPPWPQLFDVCAETRQVESGQVPSIQPAGFLHASHVSSTQNKTWNLSRAPGPPWASFQAAP